MQYLARTIVFFAGIFISLNGLTAPVFFDSFDSETGNGDGASGLSKINYDAFVNWTVSEGSVDLIAQGDFGPIDCAAAGGKCVDLDGTTGDGATMTSIDIALDPGRYKFEMLLAGVSVNFNLPNSGDPNQVDYSLLGVIGGSTTRNQGDPFVRVVREFDIGSALVTNIVIENLGGDNLGAVLDNVSITAVPLPGAIWFLIGGLGFTLKWRTLLAS